MMDNGQSFALDPLQYIGRVTRGEDGRVTNLEVFYDDSIITLDEDPRKNEFVTFRTDVLLETVPEVFRDGN
jgi:hypothetical protein